MGQVLDRIKGLAGRKVTPSGMPDLVLIIRLVIAVVLTAAALIIKIPTAVKYILLVLAVIAAGFFRIMGDRCQAGGFLREFSRIVDFCYSIC